MKKLVFWLFCCSVFATSSHAGGSHAHSHGDEGKNCSQEHAAMGHCKPGGHASVVGQPVDASKAKQTVEVDALDSMRFVFHQPFVIEPGAVIQFVVTNKGQLRHEFSIGDAIEQQKHAEAMMAEPDMHHEDGGPAVTLEPGETKSLTWEFAGDAPVVFACTLPGHYQAGMVYTQAPK